MSLKRAFSEAFFLIPLMNRTTAIMIIALIAGINLFESLILKAVKAKDRDTDGYELKIGV